MAVDMIWPLEHGVFRHRPVGDEEEAAADGDEREAEAIQHLVTYVIELAEANPDQEIRVVIGCPARATLEDRACLSQAVEGLVKYAMVASEPFLVAYGLELFNNALIIDMRRRNPRPVPHARHAPL